MKKKTKAWFKKVRGSYLPNSWQGWLTYIPFTAFLLAALIHSLKTQNSATGMLLMVFPQWVAAAVVMTWVASKRS